MSMEVLKIINKAMTSLGIEYGFAEYSGNPVVYPYCVGEYQEEAPYTEDGLQASVFTLNLFHRGKWIDLEKAKGKIENYFNQVSGRTVIADNGSGVAIFYAGALVVPTGDAELKRLQINLDIKEWKVTI